MPRYLLALSRTIETEFIIDAEDEDEALEKVINENEGVIAFEAEIDFPQMLYINEVEPDFGNIEEIISFDS